MPATTTHPVDSDSLLVLNYHVPMLRLVATTLVSVRQNETQTPRQPTENFSTPQVAKLRRNLGTADSGAYRC